MRENGCKDRCYDESSQHVFHQAIIHSALKAEWIMPNRHLLTITRYVFWSSPALTRSKYEPLAFGVGSVARCHAPLEVNCIGGITFRPSISSNSSVTAPPDG